jgi:hypothetical protein
VLQKAGVGANPHYLDVWHPTHQGNAYAVGRLISISFYSYTIFFNIHSKLNILFLVPIYGGVEEDPQASARRLEVGPLQYRRCVCCGWRYPAWKVSEYINYCLILIIVNL